MDMTVVAVKLGAHIVPGFILGEVAGAAIDERTHIPLGIAFGIAVGVVTIIAPLLWKTARAMQHFVDEHKLLRENITELRRVFNKLYCVRNAECFDAKDCDTSLEKDDE